MPRDGWILLPSRPPPPLAGITVAIGVGSPIGDLAALAWHNNTCNALAVGGIALRRIPDSPGLIGRYAFFATASPVAARH